MNLTCIAIDDEPLALEKLLSFISQIPNITCVGSYSSCVEALPQINQRNPDILFLDIEMEKITGIQLLETVPLKPYVVIISAYDRYALKGYELNVFDYILKPYSLSRLLKTTEKIQAAIREKETAQATIHKEYIFVKTDYRIMKIVIKEIYYIEGMRDYLCLHTQQGKILTHMIFSELLALLPDNEFIRIHKSFAVNIAHINTVEKHRLYINKQILPISETYRPDFYDRIT